MTATTITERTYFLDKCHKVVEANFLSLAVFFESTTVTVIKEVPKYTPDSLLSSLGGALSLYLGISIISMFELLQLAVMIMKKFC